MTTQPHPEDRIPVLALQALVAQHGFVRVVLALSANIARRPIRHVQYDTDMTNRLRRDIGLRHQPESPKYWKYLP